MFNLTATGRLTQDPVLSEHNGTALVEMSIATSRYTGKNEDGSARNVTDYLDLTVWGKIAETHAKNLGKGHLIVANGPLVQQRWETDGTKRSKHVLNADTIEYLQKPTGTAQAPSETDSENEAF